MTDWNSLPEPLQLYVAGQAFQEAVLTIAGQAEAIAREMETGHLADQGGADALRLFRALLHANASSTSAACGHA